MRFSLNLQWKILLLVTGTMSLILLASSYLHSGRTRSLIEKDHYENAVSQTLALADRISAYDYFSSLEDLRQEMQLVAGSRPDFKQIDVYQNSADGAHLIATTLPDSPNLLSLSQSGDKEQNVPQSRASSSQVNRENNEYWLITASITNPEHTGFIKALVLKSFHRKLVNSLHRQYNLVLVGAVVASVALLYVLFVYFFRRPVRDIVQTMMAARRGDLSARALVRRNDELGEIARGFNQLMDDITERSLEREGLLNQIGDLNSELLVKVDVAT